MVRKRKQTNKQTKKKKEKEKTTEDKNDTIITSGWVILDKLFRNLAASAKRERRQPEAGSSTDL